MIPQTTAFLPSADFPPSDLSTGSRRRSPIPTLCFSDEEIIEALALWAAACGSLSTLRGLVTVGEALEASAVLSQAQYAQPEDLERILETTNFAPGMYRLLFAAWGPVDSVRLPGGADWGIDFDGEEGDGPELSWWLAQQRDLVKNLPKALVVGIALVGFVALVLAAFGGHGWGEGAGK